MVNKSSISYLANVFVLLEAVLGLRKSRVDGLFHHYAVVVSFQVDVFHVGLMAEAGIVVGVNHIAVHIRGGNTSVEARVAQAKPDKIISSC